MLPWRGNGGRGAARDSLGPEKVRGPSNSLEGTRLTQSVVGLIVVGRFLVALIFRYIELRIKDQE